MTAQRAPDLAARSSGVPTVTTMNKLALWATVFADGADCQECPRNFSTETHHPYGNTHATERFRDCRGFGPNDCRSVEKLLEQEATHEQRASRGP